MELPLDSATSHTNEDTAVAAKAFPRPTSLTGVLSTTPTTTAETLDNVGQISTDGGSQSKADTHAAADYKREEIHGLVLPPRRGDIRNFLQSVGLVTDECYLLDPDVKRLIMALGWHKGADVDGSAVMFDASFNASDIVWYRKLTSSCQSVSHSGDNLTGIGDGDDETISVDLDLIPHFIHHVIFTVTIYSHDVSFDEVRSAYVRMIHGEEEYRRLLLCEYRLTEMTGHAMILGQLTRKGAYWSFNALGKPATGRTVIQLLQNQQNLLCLLESARDLIGKDAPGLFSRTRTSDPYYVIRYKKTLFTSAYVSKTLNPTWHSTPFDMGFVTETDRSPLEITLFDYDFLSKDDFLGWFQIPACALYNIGDGSHSLDFELEPSKKKEWQNEDVSGSIRLTVTITEIPANTSLSDFCV